MHGYLSSKESFYYQIEYLSKTFSVIAPDMPGFGLSEAADTPYSVEDYCLWLKDFITKLKLDCPHILAHSFGARVAIKYAGLNLSPSDKIIITGGAGIVKPRSPQYMRRVRAYRRVKKLCPGYAEKHFGSSEYRTLSPMMKESYKRIVNEDLSCYAQKISNPVLLIYGDKDNVTPPNEEGKIFNSLIKNSRLEIIDGGHFCFSEQYEKFNKIVYSFLTEQ